jgi:hypothetical protein
MIVGVGIFKYPSLMGIFTLPPPPHVAYISPMNMTSSFFNGSLEFFHPRVVPHLEDVESYGAYMSLNVVYIIDLTIPLTFINTCQKIHSHMECD